MTFQAVAVQGTSSPQGRPQPSKQRRNRENAVGTLVSLCDLGVCCLCLVSQCSSQGNVEMLNAENNRKIATVLEVKVTPQA